MKGCIRQDIAQKKVYIYNNSDVVLYDFNLVQGNTFAGYTITKVDSILVNGSYRKRWWTSVHFTLASNGDTAISIIEGIGSTGGMLCNNNPCQGVEEGWALNGYSHNGQYVYTSNNNYHCAFDASVNYQTGGLKLSIHPNPSTGLIVIESPSELHEITLINTAGIPVYREAVSGIRIAINISHLPPGVYILKAQEFHYRLIKE